MAYIIAEEFLMIALPVQTVISECYTSMFTEKTLTVYPEFLNINYLLKLL